MEQFNNQPLERTINVLIPAHNEEDQIEETIQSLNCQTKRPDSIIVIADNCTDSTIERCKKFFNVEVFTTTDNSKKKAGALNQWLDNNLPHISDNDLIMVMDADSSLCPTFLENATKYIDKGYSACGGVFQGKPGGGLVGMFQRNEYARYARDVARKDGETLVLTGTATLFLASALKEVVENRKNHVLPCIDNEAHVYDTGALTEDNELTFALLHLGYMIIAPAECSLTTEVMITWHSLWRQRRRWKRGAIENNQQYGVTKITLKYWWLQIWGFLGIIVTGIYLTSLCYAIAANTLNLRPVWIGITIIFIIERMVTVRKRGALQMLLAGTLVVEMFYDISLQVVHLIAFIDVVRKSKKRW